MPYLFVSYFVLLIAIVGDLSVCPCGISAISWRMVGHLGLVCLLINIIYIYKYR